MNVKILPRNDLGNSATKPIGKIFLYLIAISVFVGVLSANPKSPISERLAITGALHASYQ